VRLCDQERRRWRIWCCIGRSERLERRSGLGMGTLRLAQHSGPMSLSPGVTASCGSCCQSAAHPTEPHQQVTHRAGLIRLALRCGCPDSPRAPAALVAHQPGNRRLDPPASGQQRAALWRLVEAGSGTQDCVVVRDEHRPMTLRVRVRLATLVPTRAPLALGRYKAEIHAIAIAASVGY
jgi:hypothetical protein